MDKYNISKDYGNLGRITNATAVLLETMIFCGFFYYYGIKHKM
jgi:hypothetical protein